jgi:glycine hydroxymethyltransferase
MQRLANADRQIADLIQQEQQRQHGTLELIASENHTSAAVIEALGTVLTDKYAEGYPERRCYCGCGEVDKIEQLAIDRAKELFGAEHANVQPHSGTSANLAVYLAALKPGDKILGMNLAHGGHLSHGMKINQSGKLYEVVDYGVDETTERLDMDSVREIAKREQPAMIVAGASAYSRVIDFEAFAEIAREVGAKLLCDIAHIAGLVAAGEHPSPVACSDYVTTTNHKTLRGPRGGMILCKTDHAKDIDRAVFPGIQGGPLMHAVAAKAVSFGECLQPNFREYIQQVLRNCRTLAGVLADRGWRLVSGGTDNHLVLVDLRDKQPDMTGKEAAELLNRANLVCNMNAIPFDPRPPLKASGIRLGTPAVTTRGLGEAEITRIGECIDDVLMSNGDETVLQRVRDVVAELCGAFPIPNSVK